MGWAIVLLLLAFVALGLILIGRLPRRLWELVGAALLVGLAGYAWQGRPAVPGSPRDPAQTWLPFDEDLAKLRDAFGGRYGAAAQWITLSDGFARQGRTQDAANILHSGLRAQPDSAELWRCASRPTLRRRLIFTDWRLPARADSLRRARYGVGLPTVCPNSHRSTLTWNGVLPNLTSSLRDRYHAREVHTRFVARHHALCYAPATCRPGAFSAWPRSRIVPANALQTRRGRGICPWLTIAAR